MERINERRAKVTDCMIFQFSTQQFYGQVLLLNKFNTVLVVILVQGLLQVPVYKLELQIG